jgi:site-specific recombinase XerD
VKRHQTEEARDGDDSGGVRAKVGMTQEYRQADDDLISAWGDALRADGYALSSIDRATKRLRCFARQLPSGLTRATWMDVDTFYRSRQRLATERRMARRALGMKTVTVAHVHSPDWANFVARAKQFYAWAETQGFVSEATNPMRRIREYRRASEGVSVQPEWYSEMLFHPSLKPREKSLIWLLAHGLTPIEVLRLTPADVNLKACEVYVRGRHRSRTVPLSSRAVERLIPWVAAQYRLRRSWLFPSKRGRPISDRTLRHIVQAVAERVFPGPSRAGIRRELHPVGFRNTFVVRALRQGVSVDCLVSLTGIGRAELLTRYLAQTASPERVRSELKRITGCWEDWIQLYYIQLRR